MANKNSNEALSRKNELSLVYVNKENIWIRDIGDLIWLMDHELGFIKKTTNKERLNETIRN